MSTLTYAVVDVFADRPFVGNPLAVVLGADELSTAQMQTIAREFNLSETAFLLRPTTAAATHRIRIFTPGRELPFAGHPSIGAAGVLAARGVITPGRAVQECGAGLIPLVVSEDGSAVLSGGPPESGRSVDPVPLLDAVALTPADRLDPAPMSAGCGMTFAYCRVRPDAVARASLVRLSGIDHLMIFAWDGPTATAHARVFAPGAGVPEDPATGSAALGLGIWLVESGLLPGDTTSSYTVHQGAELGRPSLLAATVTATAGRVAATTVAGRVVPVAKGEIIVPAR